MKTDPKTRVTRAIYGLGAVAGASVLALGASLPWSFERELFWLRGTAWCAFVGLGITLCASPVGAVLGRLKMAKHPQIARARRALGITTAGLATLHAGLGLTTYLRDSWHLLLQLTWVRSGLLAWLVLLSLLVTSYPRLVKRARVRLWKPLHRLAYVALVLAAHHALLSPFAPRGWVALVVGTVAAFALFRLLRQRPPLPADDVPADPVAGAPAGR